jgi:hypothetical protein
MYMESTSDRAWGNIDSEEYVNVGSTQTIEDYLKIIASLFQMVSDFMLFDLPVYSSTSAKDFFFLGGGFHGAYY